MKVAIIHYWFISRRGGEKVIESIIKLYPNADIYTLFYDKKRYGNYLNKHNVYTSILDNSFFRKHHQKLFALFPFGIRSLKLKKKYDLIISSESGPAKGISIPKEIPHICYVHSPMRYCWSHFDLYVNSTNSLLRPIVRFFLKRLRNWDLTTINNVDLYISNSKNVAKRVKEFYKKESKIIYPPIDESLFQKPFPKKVDKEVYLSFGALVAYKKIDLLVNTFNSNGKKLVIIGDGPERNKLEKKAKSNIEFKGSLNWNGIEEILCKTKALLFPGEEDFGMIPLEVMAFGIPVIAYKKGGALETVVESIDDISKATGIFFEHQNSISLSEAINTFEDKESKFKPDYIRRHAAQFAEKVFLNKLSNCVDQYLGNKKYK